MEENYLYLVQIYGAYLEENYYRDYDEAVKEFNEACEGNIDWAILWVIEFDENFVQELDRNIIDYYESGEDYD